MSEQNRKVEIAETLSNNDTPFSREIFNFNLLDLDILKCICKFREPFKSITIVTETGTHEGGVNRVLKRLQRKGFVEKNDKTHEWTFYGMGKLRTILLERVEELIRNLLKG